MVPASSKANLPLSLARISYRGWRWVHAGVLGVAFLQLNQDPITLNHQLEKEERNPVLHAWDCK